MQAAKAGKLPKLIDVKDIRADLQVHSTWSDGKLSMLEMAHAAAKRGIKVIAFTDHSVSLGVTGGLSMEDHEKQQAEIEEGEKELGIISSSCMPPRSRSRLMVRWITRMSSWLRSIWYWLRCTPRCGSRARRSPNGCSTPSATRTWTSSVTPRDG